MTGKTGTNEFIFSAPGSNVITDFTASPTNEIVFSNSGFNLGLTGASSTPTQFTTAEATALFSGSGTFTTTAQRFAYNSSNGRLLYGSDGSGGTSQLVATLGTTTHPSSIAVSQLFFIS